MVLSLTRQKPLKNPTAVPMIRVTSIQTKAGRPAAFPSRIARPGAKARVASMERSSSPTIMTMPCPRTMSPSVADWNRIFSRLRLLRKEGVNTAFRRKNTATMTHTRLLSRASCILVERFMIPPLSNLFQSGFFPLFRWSGTLSFSAVPDSMFLSVSAVCAFPEPFLSRVPVSSVWMTSPCIAR